MSQQDAAKQQANTRNNIRVVSIFTAAAIGLVGVLVILYAWQLPPFTRHSQFTDNATICSAVPKSDWRQCAAERAGQHPATNRLNA